MNNVEKAKSIIDAALKFGINPSLEPIFRICELLGNPQQHYICIQVGGTNGKTSTSRYLAALLRAAGYKTGLYTSPELVHVRERVEVDGVPVEEESFAQAVLTVHAVAEANQLELTEFELITAAAFWIYDQNGVDYAVLEVGLGGRWDATTVVTPVLAVLVGVDLEHTAILGDTITAIAIEKSKIIKPGTLAVAAPTHAEAIAVFKAEAETQGSRFVEVPNVITPEPNSYQAQNKLTALTAFNELLGQDVLAESLAQTVLDQTVIPGRLETMHEDPLVIIDATHNPASARTLVNNFSVEHAILLLAILNDKDARGIIETLAPHFEEIVATQTSSPRAIPVAELAVLVEEVTGIAPETYPSPKAALDVLLQQERTVVATGSVTLAGEVRHIFLY